MNTLIIQSPHNQGTLRKYTQSSMTMMLWALWVYLLLPVLAPVLVYIGNDIQTISQIEHSLSIKQFIAIFPFIALVILGNWLWSKYNTLLYLRHHEKTQETSIHQYTSLNYFDVSAKELACWQQLKQMTVKLTEQGNVSCVKEHKLLEKSY
ncbi:MAG: poly-beta-1,6-N-acetyl-D-glucosamine biosynthesis protein PgaD [Gammaproteobacteria bacterium]|nr:poly-beta-1,6-N-acetyl-D-glucosamine biosynthesis protein PgaD [Gammaproteobacteria bacterium]